MRRWAKRAVVIVAAVALAGALGWGVVHRLSGSGAASANTRTRGPAPVAVAAIERAATITQERVFSGTLEAAAEFVVAPKINGRLEAVHVDLADVVTRGQVVAELDSEELRQQVEQAEASVAVAEAELAQARSALEIAERELDRVSSLRERGVASDSQLDAGRSEQLAREAAVKVADAELRRAESQLRSARIRLGYTSVAASWAGGDDRRVVSQRLVDEGETVAANTPLLSIVEIDPITAVVSVAERDYGRLAPGQPVTLTTDAYPGEVFAGRVARIAPVFRQASRQARVELLVENADRRLKPGMFVRARTELQRVEDAVVVPVEAIVQRDGKSVVFVVDSAGAAVSMRPVEVGIRSEGRAQLLGADFQGQVVVLGQQLLSDGSQITIPAAEPQPREAAAP